MKLKIGFEMADSSVRFGSVFFIGQSKIEGVPGVHLPHRSDPAPMTLNDALDDGQPDTGAFIFRAAVQALEHPE